MSPKVFASYSWSNAAHEQWVIDFCSSLRENGADVILDKWDLREGNDSHAFMEKLVTDDEIKKVMLICDKVYVEKANKRSGGVGTESQILSKELYQKIDQTKFVALIRERDEDGKPHVPAYYGSKVYIDLSDEESYPDNFDKVLRWIFDKPFHVKPELGPIPGYLDNPRPSSEVKATLQFRRAVDAVRQNKSNSSGSVREYLASFAASIDSFRIKFKSSQPDEEVIYSINEFIPLRNQFIEMMSVIGNYDLKGEYSAVVLEFFENLIPYFYRKLGATGWSGFEFDNLKFVVKELFLYAVAVLIRFNRFENLNELLANVYLDKNNPSGEIEMRPFTIFNQRAESLDARNQRLNLRRLSLQADLLNERTSSTGLDFDKLMEAELILYLRSVIVGIDPFWYPETHVYMGFRSPRFELFARLQSRKFFDKFKIVLGISNKEDLEVAITRLESNRGNLIRTQYGYLVPSAIINLDQVATAP